MEKNSLGWYSYCIILCWLQLDARIERQLECIIGGKPRLFYSVWYWFMLLYSYILLLIRIIYTTKMSWVKSGYLQFQTNTATQVLPLMRSSHFCSNSFTPAIRKLCFLTKCLPWLVMFCSNLSSDPKTRPLHRNPQPDMIFDPFPHTAQAKRT